ncbi:hypothetical protein DDW08_04115 [Vulcanisaeta sp. SCGC AB-777_J10]|jgi:hypothetical protein|nr:hypothetical protein DDW08_04115 [Vulcanisaeta sp. SCGC AB-777_J10]
MILLEFRGSVDGFRRLCRESVMRGSVDDVVSFDCDGLGEFDVNLHVDALTLGVNIIVQLYLHEYVDAGSLSYDLAGVLEYLNNNLNTIKSMLKYLKRLSNGLNLILGLASPYPWATFVIPNSNSIKNSLPYRVINDPCSIITMTRGNKPSMIAHYLIKALTDPISLRIDDAAETPNYVKYLRGMDGGYETADDLVRLLANKCNVEYDDDLVIIKPKA